MSLAILLALDWCFASSDGQNVLTIARIIIVGDESYIALPFTSSTTACYPLLHSSSEEISLAPRNQQSFIDHKSLESLSESESLLFRSLALGELRTTAEELDFSRTPISDKFIDALTSQNLCVKRLNLSHTSISDSSLMLLGVRCPRLQELKVNSCPFITSEGVEFFCRLVGNRLRCIEFSESRGVDWKGTLSVASYCQSLTRISFSHLDVSEIALSRLISRCSNLQSIDMSGLDVPANFVRKLCSSLPKLSYIDLSFCRGVEPSDISSIIQRFPLIEIRAFGLDLAGVVQGDSALLIF